LRGHPETSGHAILQRGIASRAYIGAGWLQLKLSDARESSEGRCSMTGEKIDDAGPADRLHLDRFIPYRLSVLTNIVSMSIAHAYEREFGLSIPEWRVMAVLARYPDLSAIEVAERTAMDKVAVSRAVQSLLARRRVTRGYDRIDKRRSMLRLSAAGQSVYKRVAPLALNYERKLLDALSASDRRALDRLIGRLIERARSMEVNGE
jgi:DNA-binding MarR family transcriptional regulator